MGASREYPRVICPECGGELVLHRNYEAAAAMTLKPILKGKKLSPYVCTGCWCEFDKGV